MYLVLFLLGIIFFGYFCGIAFFMGHGSNFYFIWLFLAAGCVAFALLMKKVFWKRMYLCGFEEFLWLVF